MTKEIKTMKDVKKNFNSIINNINYNKLNINKFGLPEQIQIELNKQDINNINLQPFFKDVLKIEILILFKYLEINENKPINNSYLEQIKIKIKAQRKEKTKYFVFRIDYHHYTDSGLFPHPKWHIQFNDRELDELNKDQFGNIIFLDTPRFFFYPLDTILTIDFILHNFKPQIREELIKTRNYSKIVKEHQTFFWKPFFNTIYKYFETSSSENKKEAQKFLPGLV